MSRHVPSAGLHIYIGETHLWQPGTQGESELLLAPFGACDVCYSEASRPVLGSSVELDAEVLDVRQAAFDRSGN